MGPGPSGLLLLTEKMDLNDERRDAMLLRLMTEALRRHWLSSRRGRAVGSAVVVAMAPLVVDILRRWLVLMAFLHGMFSQMII